MAEKWKSSEGSRSLDRLKTYTTDKRWLLVLGKVRFEGGLKRLEEKKTAKKKKKKKKKRKARDSLTFGTEKVRGEKPLRVGLY